MHIFVNISIKKMVYSIRSKNVVPRKDWLVMILKVKKKENCFKNMTV